MKLLIVSNMAHYLRDEQIVGWGPTVREIDCLAEMFDEIRHIAFLHSEPAPESSLPYTSKGISLIPVKPSGGQGMQKKLDILVAAPRYLSVMNSHLKWADIVHVRCVANISLMAIVLLAFRKHPRYRWVKYAGNWGPDRKVPLSFHFQRWWLNKGFHRGIVTINGSWPGQPAHVHSFLNPCITEDEIDRASREIEGKHLSPPFHFLFAGSLDKRKGVGRALDIAAELHRKQISFRFDVVGDGKDRSFFEAKARELGLSDVVQFHGWMARSKLNALYARSHFLLFPSENEGWPKVLSEGMAYGSVPIAGAVASIPQTLQSLNSGVALPVDDHQSFVEAILNYVKNPQKWDFESRNAVRGAGQFTYASYLTNLTTLVEQSWGVALQNCRDLTG